MDFEVGGRKSEGGSTGNPRRCVLGCLRPLIGTFSRLPELSPSSHFRLPPPTSHFPIYSFHLTFAEETINWQFLHGLFLKAGVKVPKAVLIRSAPREFFPGKQKIMRTERGTSRGASRGSCPGAHPGRPDRTPLDLPFPSSGIPSSLSPVLIVIVVVPLLLHLAGVGGF